MEDIAGGRMGSEEDAERRGGGRGMVDRVRMNQGAIVNSEHF